MTESESFKSLVKSAPRVAVLPARGGSKRILRKNLKSFLDQPMLTWPINALRASGLFDLILVSTDDSEIAELADNLGAKAIGRVASLADDYTHTTAVLKSVITNLEEFGLGDAWVYKVYPTSPLTSDIVAEFVAFAESQSSGFSISVFKSPVPTQRALLKFDGDTLRFREPGFSLARTQDLYPTYFDAGKMYGGRKSDWLETQTPLLSSPRGFELPEWLSVDMDTVEDWELAEYKFRRKFGAN